MTRYATATIVVVLALTAAVTVAAIDVLSIYLWRPLPYPSPDRLVAVDYPRTNGPSPVALMRVDAREVSAFADLSVAFAPDAFTVLGGDVPLTTDGRWISGDVFAMFGVTPVLGRTFTREEAERGAPLAMIGHAMWRDHFGGRADIIGRAITIRATIRRDAPETFTIIGVLPDRFWHLDDRTSLLLPLPGAQPPALLRLRDGVPVEAAASRLTAIVRAQVREVPPQWQVLMKPARDAHVEPVKPMLAATGWAVVLLAAVALGNLACLQIAGGVSRQREFAVRTVLGARSVDLFRQVAREGLITGAAAGAVAAALVLVLLRAGGAAIEQYAGRLIPGQTDVADPRLYLITIVVTMIAALGLSAIMLAASKVPAIATALSGGPAMSDTPKRLTIRQIVVSTQIAIAFCLLVASALMIRTSWRLGTLDLGFEPHAVLSANVTLHQATLRTLDQQRAFFLDLTERLQRLPEVEHAGLTGWLPFRVGPTVMVLPDGAPEASSGSAALQGVNPAYFDALRLRLREGRFIDTTDRSGRGNAAVISQSLARTLWPENPVGRKFRIKFSPEPGRGFGPYTVVGVVDDVMQSVMRPTPPQIYTAFYQQPIALNAFLQVKTRVDPMQAAGAIARVVHDMDPDLPLGSVNTLESIVDAEGLRPRLLARTLAGLATLAVMIAMIGLYAVSEWIALLRQREAALRVALGADRQGVAAMLARRGLIAIASGLVLGWIAALPMAALIASEVKGVSANDVGTRLLVSLLLTIVSLTALFGPVWRVSSGNIAALLRNE